MRRRGSLAILVAVVVPAGAASSALAQNDLYDDYREDGQVNPCTYSRGEIRKNLRDLPPDVQQYAPGLGDQLRRPCHVPQPAPVQEQDTPAAPAPAAGPPPPPRPDRPRVLSPPAPEPPRLGTVDATTPAVAAEGGGIPGWLAVGLGCLGALALAVLVAGRLAGLSVEALTRPLRASLADAGGRAGDRAGDLRDVFRFRR